jgi:predicted outer membrane repeat protein
MPRPTDTPSPTNTPSPTDTPWPTPTPWAQPDDPGTRTITVCTQGCAFTTLQAALDDAGTGAGDVLYLADAVHTEQGIAVQADVTIQGRGAGYTVLQAHERPGKATDRILHVAEGATVTLQGLTLRHGHPREGVRSGGAVLNHGALTVRHCLIHDNRSNCGAGILTVGGTLTVTHSTFRDNWADGEGEAGFECGSGAAIKLEDESTATLEHVTLTGNRGEGKGGGLHVSCTSRATLVNCTVSGNHAVGLGGGISAKGDLTLVHCTIQGNSAKGVVRGVRIDTQAGGGIAVRGQSVLRMSRTLIANNPKDGDCMLGPQVTVADNAHNWIEDGSCTPAFSGDPGLAPLGDYGGDTPTHALLPGSPALGVLPADACTLPTDQRGLPRPGVDCTVGAFELGG